MLHYLIRNGTSAPSNMDEVWHGQAEGAAMIQFVQTCPRNTLV